MTPEENESLRAAVLSEALLEPSTIELGDGIRAHKLSLQILRRLSRCGNPLASFDTAAGVPSAERPTLNAICEAMLLCSCSADEFSAYFAAEAATREKILDAFCARLSADALPRFSAFLSGDSAAARLAQAEPIPEPGAKSKNVRTPPRLRGSSQPSRRK